MLNVITLYHPDEHPFRIQDEDIFEYIRRRCQRYSLFNSDRDMKVRVKQINDCMKNEKFRMLRKHDLSRLNNEQESMKWSIYDEADIESTRESSHDNNSDSLHDSSETLNEPAVDKTSQDSSNDDNQKTTINKKKKKNAYEHPLSGVELGNFKRVIVTASQEDSRIVCSCEKFRRDGTCIESKLFGLLVGEKYPPPSCIDKEQVVTWQRIRHELIDVFAKKQITYHSVLDKDYHPPAKDPMTNLTSNSNIHST